MSLITLNRGGVVDARLSHESRDAVWLWISTERAGRGAHLTPGEAERLGQALLDAADEARALINKRDEIEAALEEAAHGIGIPVAEVASALATAGYKVVKDLD